MLSNQARFCRRCLPTRWFTALNNLLLWLWTSPRHLYWSEWNKPLVLLQKLSSVISWRQCLVESGPKQAPQTYADSINVLVSLFGLSHKVLVDQFQLFRWRRAELHRVRFRGQQSLHLPRQEGVAHRRPLRPRPDGQLRFLEPRLPSGPRFDVRRRDHQGLGPGGALQKVAVGRVRNFEFFALATSPEREWAERRCRKQLQQRGHVKVFENLRKVKRSLRDLEDFFFSLNYGETNSRWKSWWFLRFCVARQFFFSKNWFLFSLVFFCRKKIILESN